MAKSKVKQRAIWWAVFLLCLLPLIYNVWQIYLAQTGGEHRLGSEPGKVLVDNFGEVSFYFLWAVLAISPLKFWLGVSKPMKFRRMIGLYVFFYAGLHILAYGTFLLQWSWFLLQEDIVQRPYIFVGLLAWIGLLVLSITSPKWMMKKLKKNWILIHRFVYLIAILAVIHEWMQLRASILEPLVHALIVAALLILRLPFVKQLKKRAKSK